MYYVYVLATLDGSKTYIGYTSDLKRRLNEHNTGRNTSTRGYQWKLIYYEAYLSKEDAKERERKLKQRGSSKHSLFRRLTNSFELLK